MKINRTAIYEKYGGRCAYCGEELTIKQMQVDHIIPKMHSHWHKNLDPNRIENLNPACRKCNYAKYIWDVEMFRREMQSQVSRLLRSYNFKMALKYGQVQITEKPVLFYFEKIKGEKNDPILQN